MQAGFGYYRVGQAVSRSLPRAAAAALSRALAAGYARFSPDLPALTANMRAALGSPAEDAAVRGAARRLIVNYADYLVDLFYSDHLDRAAIAGRIRAEGLEHLDRALRSGRGAIVVSAHLGHWEIGAMALSLRGYPVNVIALTHRDRRIDALFLARRAQHGVQTIPLGRPREALRALERGQIVALNADRPFGDRLVEVPFFGRRLPFPSGYARLSLKAGAPVLPTFFVGDGKGGYVLRIRPPLAGPGEDGIVRAFIAEVEAAVRRDPTQWYIFQRFDETPQWPV